MTKKKPAQIHNSDNDDDNPNKLSTLFTYYYNCNCQSILTCKWLTFYWSSVATKFAECALQELLQYLIQTCLSSISGVSTFTFLVAKCFLSRNELTRNPVKEKMVSIAQNTWNGPMLSLSQKRYDRNTDIEPHPLNTEQYQLRAVRSSDDKAKSASNARWFKSIIVKKPSYKHRQITNWIDGWHHWNHMQKKASVNSGPYVISDLWNKKGRVFC